MIFKPVIPAPIECGCGGKPYIDWWINIRTKKKETFVRCPGCGCVGEGCQTEEEAIKAWETFKEIDADSHL